MKIAKQLFRRPVTLNLSLHVCLGAAGVILLALPVLPFANGHTNLFRWLFAAGFILFFGIGDGYPPVEMKIPGGAILAVLALAVLATLVLNFSLVLRLLFDRTKSWQIRACFFTGVAIVWMLSIFAVWVSAGTMQ